MDWLAWGGFAFIGIALIYQIRENHRLRRGDDKGRKVLIQKLEVFRNVIGSMVLEIEECKNSLDQMGEGFLSSGSDGVIYRDTTCFTTNGISDEDKRVAAEILFGKEIANQGAYIYFTNILDILTSDFGGRQTKVAAKTYSDIEENLQWLKTRLFQLDEVLVILEKV